MKKCLLGLALLSSIATPAIANPVEPDLAAVRAATERFRDVKVALAEGYIADPMNVHGASPCAQKGPGWPVAPGSATYGTAAAGNGRRRVQSAVARH